MEKADSTLRTSQAVPHPSTNRALCRLISEVRRDPVHSTRYGRQRKGKVNVSILVLLCEVAPCNTHRAPHTSDLQEDSTNQATGPHTPAQTDTPSRQKQEEAGHTTHDERRTTTNERDKDERRRSEGRTTTHTDTENFGADGWAKEEKKPRNTGGTSQVVPHLEMASTLKQILGPRNGKS